MCLATFSLSVQHLGWFCFLVLAALNTNEQVCLWQNEVLWASGLEPWLQEMLSRWWDAV